MRYVDLAAAPSPEGAEHETAYERGDEAGAADRIRNSEGEAGAGQQARPGARSRRRAGAHLRPRRRTRRRCPRSHPGEDAVADLLEHQPNRGSVADRSGLRLRDREHDPEQRHADPVVEAALDVQALSHSAREPRQRHDRLTERRVRRREDHREEQRFGPESSGNTTSATTNPATSVSGRPIPSRRSGTESSPRSARTSIREASANRTSASVASASSLTVSPAGATLDQPQRLRADQQSDGGEDHRRGDRRARDSARDRREREQSQRDNGERPVHRRSLFNRFTARSLGWRLGRGGGRG